MNDYYAVLFGKVERQGGIVSDMVGDAMLAIWAASSSESSLRAQACQASLEMAKAIEQFNPTRRETAAAHPYRVAFLSQAALKLKETWVGG